MWQAKLLGFAFLHKVPKIKLLYWVNVGIETQRMSHGNHGRGVNWVFLPIFSIRSKFYDYNLLVYRWNWLIKSFMKKIIGNCLFSVILSILAPIFALSPVLYLFPPPNTLLSSYCYQICCIDVVAIHVLSCICHQDMWKIPLALSCFFFSAIFLPIFRKRLRFGGSGSLVESKWCHYAMVEADSNLKLLPPSTLDI